MTTPADEGGLHCDHAAAVLKAMVKRRAKRMGDVTNADFIGALQGETLDVGSAV
jgi:hypothetical protein